MASYFDEHYLLTHGQSHSDDGSRAEALSAARLARVSPGARILDAPGGFGRHAIPLAEAGFDVVLCLYNSLGHHGEEGRSADATRAPTGAPPGRPPRARGLPPRPARAGVPAPGRG